MPDLSSGRNARQYGTLLHEATHESPNQGKIFEARRGKLHGEDHVRSKSVASLVDFTGSDCYVRLSADLYLLLISLTPGIGQVTEKGMCKITSASRICSGVGFLI